MLSVSSENKLKARFFSEFKGNTIRLNSREKTKLFRSCKGFFRRVYMSDKKFECYRGNMCVIQKGTRNICRACRYKKCLQVGMNVKGSTTRHNLRINIYVQTSAESTPHLKVLNTRDQAPRKVLPRVQRTPKWEWQRRWKWLKSIWIWKSKWEVFLFEIENKQCGTKYIRNMLCDTPSIWNMGCKSDYTKPVPVVFGVMIFCLTFWSGFHPVRLIPITGYHNFRERQTKRRMITQKGTKNSGRPVACPDLKSQDAKYLITCLVPIAPWLRCSKINFRYCENNYCESNMCREEENRLIDRMLSSTVHELIQKTSPQCPRFKVC